MIVHSFFFIIILISENNPPPIIFPKYCYFFLSIATTGGSNPAGPYPYGVLTYRTIIAFTWTKNKNLFLLKMIISIQGIPPIVETIYDSNKYFSGHIILYLAQRCMYIVYMYMYMYVLLYFYFYTKEISVRIWLLYFQRERTVLLN